MGGHRSLEGNNLGGTASIALDMAIEDDVRQSASSAVKSNSFKQSEGWPDLFDSL